MFAIFHIDRTNTTTLTVHVTVDTDPSDLEAPVLHAAVNFGPGRSVDLRSLSDDCGTPLSDTLPPTVVRYIEDHVLSAGLLDHVARALRNCDSEAGHIFRSFPDDDPDTIAKEERINPH